ncbi:MAG: molybdopterin-synthase adenylyltransferase MoeB [Magnetococcales bacterium]|nr:molybdopterin-synthase adenylyltransferase MoeB [Magnetococcales bacterium]
MLTELASSHIERYARQILLPEIGGAGQLRLLNARVVVLGAGGLGSAAALYLAAAGVGHLIIADHDRVELSNLQRQILHTTERVGQTKTASARQAIAALNPEVQVTLCTERILQEGVDALVQQGDLVVDGSDNFASRYLLNQACFLAKKPLVSAAVLGFEGQLTTFRHGVDATAPCYRCLYPHPPAPGSTPTCRSAGVLGALTGILGAWQAAEAIKELLGVGETLAGSLLLLNVLHGQWQRIRFAKNPACPLCASPNAIGERHVP